MSPLFKKLNLGSHKTVHVLNAPASFEPELAVLDGITVKRAVSGTCSFAIAFVVTQTELDTASKMLSGACDGDAVLWVAYPKGTSKKYRCEFNRDSGWLLLPLQGMSRYEWWPSTQTGQHYVFAKSNTSRACHALRQMPSPRQASERPLAVAPNPFIERTASSQLRCLKSAAHVER